MALDNDKGRYQSCVWCIRCNFCLIFSLFYFVLSSKWAHCCTKWLNKVYLIVVPIQLWVHLRFHVILCWLFYLLCSFSWSLQEKYKVQWFSGMFKGGVTSCRCSCIYAYPSQRIWCGMHLLVEVQNIYMYSRVSFSDTFPLHQLHWKMIKEKVLHHESIKPKA